MLNEPSAAPIPVLPLLPAYLADALEHVADGVLGVDATHHITYANAAIFRTLGLAREALVGQALWSVFPELLNTVFEQRYAETVATQAPVEFDMPNAHLGIWLHVRMVPSADGLAIYLTDISHEKRSVTTLSTFLDASPDAAILLDRQGIVLAVNQHTLDRMGTTREALIGTDGYAALPPELVAQRRQRNEDVMRGGASVTFIDGWADELYENTVVPVADDKGVVTRLAIFSRNITPQKQVEHPLRDRSAFFALLAESIPQYLFWKDANSVYQGCNTLFAHAAGLESPTDIIGKTDYDLGWKREKSDEFRARDQRVMTTEQAERHIEESRQLSDGSTLVLDVNKVPIRNTEGRVVGVLGIYDDITERRLAEEALKASEARFRAIVANTMLGLVVVDLNGYIISANAAIERMIGYTAEELRTRRFTDITHADDVHTSRLLFQELLAGARESYQMEKRYRRKDGSILWAQLSVSVIRAANGAPEAIIGAVEDITERKQAEEAIRESETNYRALLGALDESVCMVDRHGTLLVVNAIAAARCHCTPDEMVGHSFRDFLSPDLARTRWKIIESVFASGESLHSEDTRDGIVFSHTTYPVFDTDHAVVRVVSVSHDISERKQAEEDLRESNARLVLAQQSAGAGIWTWDMVTGTLEWSNELYRLFGLDPMMDAASFPTWTRVVHPDDAAMAGARIEQAIATHTPLSSEYRIVLPTGEMRWIHALGDTLYADDGTPRSMSGICIDITARKQTEAALQEREAVIHRQQQELSLRNQQLQGLFDYAPAGLVLYEATPPYRIIAHNVYYQQMWAEGAFPQGMVGLGLDEYAPAVQESGIRAVFDEVVQTKRGKTLLGFPYDGFSHRGRTWWNWVCTPVIQEDEVIALAHMAIDVTDEVLARQQAEIATAEVAQERDLLHQMIEMLPVGVWLLDGDGVIKEGNQASQGIWAGARLVGLEQFGEYRAWHTDTGKELTAEEWAGARAISHGDTTLGEELRIECFDGTTKYILNSAVPIRDAHGTITGAVVVNMDITALKEIDHAKDEFLAVLSHELQTPLTSMLGFTSIALENDTLQAYRQAIPVIERNAKRQARLINELLDMSKLLEGRPECRPQLIDLCQLTSTTVEHLRLSAERKGLSLRQCHPDASVSLVADPSAIRTCIEHLIGNSIKFTHTGGTITVSCREEDEIAILTVTDDGRGIDPAHLPLLFTPFQQVERDEAAGGLGLGLAVVRGYVEWHGGTVSVESLGRNQGSTFTMRLPKHTQTQVLGGG